MKQKTSAATQTYHLTILTRKGGKSKKVVIPPTELPSDMVPGEFVMIPDHQGRSQWYVYCDKQRWWSNGRWNLGGTVIPFDNTLPESEIYELRRSLLKLCGWI